jgi:hypothetical protein
MPQNLIDKYIPDISNIDMDFDDQIFDRLMNFIMELDPEILSDEQLEEISDILDNIEMHGEEVSELRRAKRSPPEKKRISRQFWRRNKQKIKKKRAKFKKSAEGRKRKRKKTRMAKSNKTPLGRRKITYNI